MKTGTLTLVTTGDRVTGTFTDHLGNSVEILRGRSLNDITKAIEQMILLMQHRNGIVNYNQDGSVAKRLTEELIPDIVAIAMADKGTGWY